MENKLLKDLYCCFYTPPESPVQNQKFKECNQPLIEALNKLERRLVFQIIDAKIENTSIASFFSGYELPCKLFAELNHYENEHRLSCLGVRESGARFIFKREEVK